MPASKQSGALKVVLPLVAALILFTAVFGPTLFGGKKSQTQPAQTEGETAQGVVPDGTAEDKTPSETVALGADDDPAPANDDTFATTETQDVDVEPAPAPVNIPTAQAPDDGAGPPSAWALRVNEAPITTDVLGSIDPTSDYELEIEINPNGMGIERARFTNHYKTAIQDQTVRSGTPAQEDWHYAVSAERRGDAGTVRIGMINALAVFVRDPSSGRGEDFKLSSEKVWERTGPSTYRATIENGLGEPALVITRRFQLATDSYDLEVVQTVENLTDGALDVVWYQYGPGDMPPETSGYRIPTRRVRVGYTDASDPQYVRADGEIRELSKMVKLAGKQPDGLRPIWPDNAYKDAGALAWVVQSNRHFMFAVHPDTDLAKAQAHNKDPKANPLDKTLKLGAEKVLARGLAAAQPAQNVTPHEQHVQIAMQSAVMPVGAGATLDLSFGAYLGPLDDRFLSASKNPRYGVLNLKDVVVYQIGFCGVCTFQWIARPLLGLLRFFHGNVVFDWGLAIILLVICVRALLHPITKKSQISMMRFGKQMQALAPKQQKIKERYKDDKQRMNQELAKLMREERINPLGMLGCLPMFLQTPIWIALYATIYFAFDLRHEPAFFGVFQNFGGWTFLNDLSSPDHFIDFGKTVFTVPLMGAVSGFNILPLLMGAIFFVQQKYMSPPPTGNQSPEQEQTQKIMKVMLVVMMPVFMYNAPSGLTLYILTSSSIGVLESRYIRSHVDKIDLEAPKKPSPAGPRKQVKNTAFSRGAEPRKHFKDRGKG